MSSSPRFGERVRMRAGSSVLLAAFCVAPVARAAPETSDGPDEVAVEGGAEFEWIEADAQDSILLAHVAAQRAVNSSEELAAEQQSTVAQRLAYEQAQLDWWPTLTLSARYTRLSAFAQPQLGTFVAAPGVESGPIPPGTQLVAVDAAFPAILNQYMLQARVVVPVTDYVFRVREQLDAAQHATQATELRSAATRQRLARDVGLLFYAYARAVASRSVTEQGVIDAERHLETVRSRVQAGTATTADELSARARLAASSRLHTQSRLAQERLRRDLAAMMHAAPEETWAVPRGLAQPLASMPRPELQALLEEAFDQRVELEVYRSSGVAERARARAARAAGLPQLDVFGAAMEANPNPRLVPPQARWRGTWEAGVQLSWTPNAWAKARSRANAIDARSRSLAAQGALMRDAVRREVHAALQRVQEADAAVLSTADEIAAAAEAHRARREAYAAGNATVSDVQDAESALIGARLARVQAVIAQRSSRLELAFALGRDLAASGSWP